MTFGVPYHRQRRVHDIVTNRTVTVSICPICGAEYPMVRKDFESHSLSNEAVAHVNTHEKG